MYIHLNILLDISQIKLQLLVNITIDGTQYEGSFICPSCLSLCYVS